jgi:hypothetical protein
MTFEELYSYIANLIVDYRRGEIAEPTPEHVYRWITQFTPENQYAVLLETKNILDKLYLTEENVDVFLEAIATNKKIVGENAGAFWQSACFFEGQQQGNSLKEMTQKLQEILQQQLGVSSTGGEDSHTHIYIDDFLFTGNRLIHDLTTWIENRNNVPTKVHIILIGWHRSGQWYAQNKLRSIARDHNKNITFQFWSIEDLRLENRLRYIDKSEVLWPTIDVCNDITINNYIDTIDPEREKIRFREKVEHESRIYSNEANRAILEYEFTLAGLKIRSYSQDPSDILKPLGYSPFANLGFGSMITTYRNCPNNCPLALWWGSPTAGSNHPLGKWYPLLERKTYEHVETGFSPFIDIDSIFS